MNVVAWKDGKKIVYYTSGSKYAVPKCSHHGERVRVGKYHILVGGLRNLSPVDISKADIVIPLEPEIPVAIGQYCLVLGCPWRDQQAPPIAFEQFLTEDVVPLLKKGKKILVYCRGGHGRTGTFLASLIAILEAETDDPIAAVRSRHCKESVESREQAMFIFRLRGLQVLPVRYKKEFPLRPAKAVYGRYVALARPKQSAYSPNALTADPSDHVDDSEPPQDSADEKQWYDDYGLHDQ